MNQSTLDKEMIAQPELWSLAMQLREHRLDVALFPPIEREEMIWRTIELDPALPRLKALENAIYENPLLLSDFRSIKCSVGTEVAMAVPSEASADEANVLMDAAFEDLEGIPVECPLGADNARLVMMMDSDEEGFLRRTFFNIRITHRLAVLASYFSGRHEWGTDVRMCAMADPEGVDLIAFDGERKLQLLNSFRCKEVMDMAYYILACATELGLIGEGSAAGPIIIGGDREIASELMQIVRRYSPSVAAMPFPALSFRPSKDLLQAPVELLMLSVCE